MNQESSHALPPPKDLVLCFDGTGDWVAQDVTNVAKIYRAADKTAYSCFYDGGVGTLSNPGEQDPVARTITRLTDAGLATGIGEKVLNGYRFLIRNYKPDARIYLFGFSRGAYTARLLTALVHNFGVLRPEAENLAPYLWQALAEVGLIGAFKHSANRIKHDFSIPDAKIEFMGLFDTVSSVGVLRRFLTYPNTSFNPSVLRTCHAVSIDEQRNGFPECLMHPEQENLTEVWFPGVHRDIGGGLDRAGSGISDKTLEWISGEAQASGLVLTFDKADPPGPPSPNYAPLDPYVLVGLYPMKMFASDVSSYRCFWPNFFHVRTVPVTALVDQLALDMRTNPAAGYDPKNLPANVQPFHADRPVVSVPRRYDLTPARPNVEDMAGIFLGTTFCFLLWNWASRQPFGDSWPVWHSPFTMPGLDLNAGSINWNSSWTIDSIGIATFGFIAFVVALSVGQAKTVRWPDLLKPRTGKVMVLLAILLLLVIFGLFGFWQAVQWGCGAGVLFTLLAQAPGAPTLSADRTLPYIAGASVLAGISFNLFIWITGGLGQSLQLDSIIVFVYWGLFAAVAIVNDRSLIRRNAKQSRTRPVSTSLMRSFMRFGLCGGLLCLLWIVGGAGERGMGGLASVIGLAFACAGACGMVAHRAKVPGGES